MSLQWSLFQLTCPESIQTSLRVMYLIQEYNIGSWFERLNKNLSQLWYRVNNTIRLTNADGEPTKHLINIIMCVSNHHEANLNLEVFEGEQTILLLIKNHYIFEISLLDQPSTKFEHVMVFIIRTCVIQLQIQERRKTILLVKNSPQRFNEQVGSCWYTCIMQKHPRCFAVNQ